VFTEDKPIATTTQGAADISIQNATFAWSSSEVTSSAAARSFRLQIEGSLSFRRGRINLVVGPTGSGKTSLLMALLGMILIHP
jgi:ABC-type Mn2+/Zn2+ transport system ATPase subunit